MVSLCLLQTRDACGGRLVATVGDPGGNVLGLLQDREEARGG